MAKGIIQIEFDLPDECTDAQFEEVWHWVDAALQNGDHSILEDEFNGAEYSYNITYAKLKQ